MRKKNSVIEVLNTEVKINTIEEKDYISITDIARFKDSARTDYIIQNWLRNRNTIEFLGIWEHLNNPDFNPIEFDGIKKQAGLNSSQPERLQKLNQIAIQQMALLLENHIS